MTRAQIENVYFDWLYDIACDGKKKSYTKLLRTLHSIDFTYSIPMDGNRAAEGEDLRYRFGWEEGYEDAEIAKFLDIRPCSMLEMMVGLSIHFEEQIMRDPAFGDRTSVWFWEMITNLGLSSMSDDHFNPTRVENAISICLNREYKPDGTGGLFKIEGCLTDLREVEIWYQGCWYLSTIT